MSRDFLWVQCKITSSLVPSPSAERRNLHAGCGVSFKQAPSSTSRSQFNVFLSPLSKSLPLTSTTCFGTSYPIFLFMWVTRRNLGPHVLPISWTLISCDSQYRLLYNHLPSHCPISWKNWHFLSSIYQFSTWLPICLHTSLTSPFFFFLKGKLASPHGPYFPWSLLSSGSSFLSQTHITRSRCEVVSSFLLISSSISSFLTTP